MSTNLRVSLTILSVGFAVEGGAELYSLLTAGAFLPGTSLFFLVPAAATLLGLLFLLIGKHEWGDVHQARVRRTNRLFGLSLAAAFVAAVELAVLAAYPSLGLPLWATVLFGTAVAGFLFGTFLTYAQLVAHLVSRPSKAALVVATVWALGVSVFIGAALASDLPTILTAIATRSFSIAYLVSPVDYLASFLFVSYFLLLGAYVDAHLTVARRRERWPRQKVSAAPRFAKVPRSPRRASAAAGRASTPGSAGAAPSDPSPSLTADTGVRPVSVD
jgi:hypothetical protein